LRMPLLMRLPGFVPAGSERRELVQNLDFAPTFLDLAGLAPPADMQGASFWPMLRGERVRGWRDAVYYHYYEYPAVHMVKRHYGVRTARYKLMHFYHDIDAWELYDLKRDPRELRNIYDDPGYADVREDLRQELRRLQALYGDSDELAQRFLQEDLARGKKSPD
ncbi:MAG: DUF4976 domain-containing protein, partial [Candidatus Aminicenantes bacterium]|nr:DUF4976 domain-containing protein [Candidatus Aminicenantes bacterium]